MRVPCQIPPERKGPRRRSAALVLGAALAGGIAVFWLCDGMVAVHAWLRRSGHHAIEHRTRTWHALAALPARWLTYVPAPRIDLEIAFKNVLALRAAQQKALRQGFQDAATKAELPGRVVVGGVRTQAKLRLKGDHVDHVEARKVSFRVQLEGDPPVFGLREFSVQAPWTKGWHLEALFHATARHEGVLAPRYEFVRASYNGEDVGVMALEEHCTKELLERQGRRDSVVVRFVEEPMFATQARLRSADPDEVALDDYRTAAVEPIGPDHAYPQQDVALGLLRAFVGGTLLPSQVFAVEDLAAYLAVCELWGAWHPLRWHNLRFHFDPLTGRLAPVAFDGNLQMRRSLGCVVVTEEPIVAAMLADPAVFTAFRRRLRTLCDTVAGGKLVPLLQGVEQGALPLLQSEWWLLQGFPFDELRARAAYLATLHDATFACQAADPNVHPILVSQVAADRFTLRNVTAWEVDVHSLRWARPDGRTLAAELPAAWGTVLRLAAKPAAGPIPETELRLAPPPGAGDLTLEVEARVATVSERHFVRALPQPAAARETALAEPSLTALLAEQPWLRLDEDGHTLRVLGGRQAVAKTAVLPRGYRLVADPGTELLFAADAALVVQGPVVFAGHAGAPIVLAGAGDAGWPGVAVLAADDAHSVWQHVRVRDTLGVRAGALTYTGGVVFDRGRVQLADVLLSGTRAEDALNIIRAEVTLRRVHVERTVSDAFDGDFVHGSIEDCAFTDIGGDAVDVSGADVSVRGCRMRKVRDKALSVGEGSRVTASQLDAEGVGAGAACKDGSTLVLADSRIAGAQVAGVMAYVKKPEFGVCKLTLTKVVCDGVRVQHGSTATRDGVALPTEAIDVDLLYSTVMRK